MLWIRSSDAIHKRATTTSAGSETLSRLPLVQLNDAVGGRPTGDAAIFIQEDKPDLGLLYLHRDRLAAAAEAFGWRNLEFLEHSEQALRKLRAAIENHMKKLPIPSPTFREARKVRVLVDKVGNTTIDSTVLDVQTAPNPSSLLTGPFIPQSLDQPWPPEKPRCKVYLDYQPTKPSTLTTHKTIHRCVYTSARERLDIKPTTPPTAQEVLIYNPCGEIIETSCCTVYFKRDGAWITPAAICGPTLGVSRRLAIESGLCKQGTIELRELEVYEEVWLSNAVRGFFKGVLITDAKRLNESAESREALCAKLHAGLAADGG